MSNHKFSAKDEHAIEEGEHELEILEEQFIEHMIHDKHDKEDEHMAEDWMHAMENIEYQVATADFTDDSDPDSEEEEDEFERVDSFLDSNFYSEAMRTLLRNIEAPDFKNQHDNADLRYKPKNIFPDWLLRSREWKTTKARKDNDQDVSEILHIPPGQRTAEQKSVLVQWIMSVWQTATLMGIKKCNAMLSEYKYAIYEPEQDIIVEGESGMIFYIIISGETVVIKNGIGIVAKLGKGKSFGELALTKGDVRTATIRTVTRCEVLSLHKLDYDHFVKDIQLAERREHFFLLRECALFSKWTRHKIDKLCNTCTRKNFEAGACIFRQGDEPDRVFIIMDGVVEIIKEVHIVCKNRWPTDLNEWKTSAKQTIKPIRVSILRRADYFGELSIVRNTVRAASAYAISKCTLVTVDKLEFLHLVNQSKTSELEPLTRQAKAYPSDTEIIAVIGHISGGPQTEARLGEVFIQPNKIEKLAEVDARAATRLGQRKKKTPQEIEAEKQEALKKTDRLDTTKMDITRKVKRSANLAKLGSVLQEARHESNEVEAARKEDQLIAADIEAAGKHAEVDLHPLQGVFIPKYKSISLASRPVPGKTEQSGEEKSGHGSFAAEVDPIDRVVFSSRVMLDKPTCKIRVPVEEAQPLIGTVLNVKRVPTGTELRRLALSSSLDSLLASRSPKSCAKLPLVRVDPRLDRPASKIGVREFVKRAKITYRDALFREGTE